MEFDFLGERCSLPNCRRHDYLPFTCSKCNHVFCSEHGTPASHNCSSLKTTPTPSSSATPVALVPLPCKACGEIVTQIPANASAAAKAAALRAHKPDCAHTRKNAPICGVPDCKERLSSPITCRDCSIAYCVRHRSAVRHNCVALKANNNKSQERNIPVVAPSRFVPKKKVPNSAIHPYGDPSVEGHNRVYCELTLKTANACARKYYFFFSKRWTVGRALDSISQRVQVPIRSPDGRRLQLRVGDDTKPFLSLIGDVIPQHAAVCVEYEAVVTGRDVNSGISTSPIVSIDLTRD